MEWRVPVPHEGLLVRGSVIYNWLGRLLEQGVDCSELRQHIKPLFGESVEPASGIAAVTRDAGRPGLQVVPISLRFGPADLPDGDVTCENPELRELAKSAVAWAGEYLRRFSGALERVVNENHWGSDRPYSLATFIVPDAKYDPPGTVHAAMALAYLARIFRDTLVHDLQLPVDFPGSLLVCAAGFDGQSSTVTGVPDLAHAVENFRFEKPAKVLHARLQQPEFRDVRLPAGVDLMPIDLPEGLPLQLLVNLVEVTKSPKVAGCFRQTFTAALTDLVEQEKAVENARLSVLGHEAPLKDVQKRFFVGLKKQDYLAQKLKEVQQKAAKREPLPLPSVVAEELGSLHDSWMAEAGLVELVEPATPEEEEEVRKAHRLWRRLSWSVASDLNPDEAAKLSEALRHTTLNERKQDLLYLEGMEGALDPFGVEPTHPVNEDTVSRWFDRLFHLATVQHRLRERTAEARAEAQSYGEEWKAELGEALEQARQALRVQNSKIDALWWELRWRLGREPLNPQL